MGRKTTVMHFGKTIITLCKELNVARSTLRKCIDRLQHQRKFTYENLVADVELAKARGSARCNGLKPDGKFAKKNYLRDAIIEKPIMPGFYVF